jgi:Protein of unknown function (DUF3500)
MPKSKSRSSCGREWPDRRCVVLGGSALLGATALPGVGAAADDGLGSAADLLAATRKFLSSLEPAKRKAASFAWNAPEWSGWNYFGSAGFIKPGLRLEQMSPEQKALAWDLLATLLSPVGRQKAKNVMTLQPALCGAVLVRRVRHAGRDRRVGLPPRGAPSDPVDRRA